MSLISISNTQFRFIVTVVLTAFLMAGAQSQLAHAEDTTAASQPTKSTKKKAVKTDESSSAPTSSTTTEIITSAPSSTSTTEATNENNRLKTLEGSKSPWSFQLNLSYYGSSIDHPLSENAPNPGNEVPAPLVYTTGTIAGRYRLDKTTTIGVGIGVTAYKPFQGFKDPSAANPYADIAKSYRIGPFKGRGDFQLGFYTDNQYSTLDGYIFGPTLTNEIYYTSDFGLTSGLFLEFDYNFFKSNDSGQYPTNQQTEWDIYTDPYFEYSLSKKVNLRSVIGIGSLHNNNQPGSWALFHPKIYQTFGVGFAALEAWYIYTYVKVRNYNDVSDKTVTFGFNTIINLF